MKLPIKNNLIVELHVPDFAPVKEFYSKLGFEVISEDPKGENYPGYLVLKRQDTLGNTILNFYGDDERVYNQSYFKKFPKDTVRGYATELTIPTADIDNFYALVKNLLPQYIVKELQQAKDDHATWRDFRVADSYGYYLRFTELIDWGQK